MVGHFKVSPSVDPFCQEVRCAQVPGNKAAIGQYYNAAADRYVSFDGIVKALAAEVGKEPKILLYDESKVKLAKGEGVPFRTKHFFAQVRQSMPVLLL